MTTLAAGSSVTVAVRDGGTVAIATNGGLASAVVTLTEGGTQTVSLGPLTERRTLGPYAEGASIVITNSSCGAFDYDVETRNDPSSVAITGGTINGVPVSQITSGTQAAPLRIATFGDSTANVTLAAITQQDLTAYAPTFPGSGTTSIGMDGAKFLLPALYPQAYLVGNGGISGENTTTMLARDTGAASSTRKATADVINLLPDVVLLRGASINDLTTVTAGTLAATVSAVFSRHCQLISRLLSGGALVIDEGCYGFAGSATDLASTRSAIIQLNALFQSYAAQYPGRVYFINPVGLTCDSTGAYLANMSSDGTHLTVAGQYVVSAAERDLLTIIFGRSVGPRFRGVNCVVNSMLANTGVQGYGTLATGFTVTGTNITRQNAKVEIIDGASWQTCEFVPTGGGAVTAAFSLPYDPSSASTVSPMNIVANDIYGFEYDFLAQDLNGGPPPVPTGILGRVATIKSAAGTVVWDSLSPSWFAGFGSAFKGKCIVGPITFTEPSANLTNGSSWTFNYQTADQATSFKLGVSQPRIVKLGTALTRM